MAQLKIRHVTRSVKKSFRYCSDASLAGTGKHVSLVFHSLAYSVTISEFSFLTNMCYLKLRQFLQFASVKERKLKVLQERLHYSTLKAFLC